MLNYCLMDLIDELEQALENPSQQPPSAVRVRLDGIEIELRLPQLGKDYLAGLSDGRVKAMPLCRVIELVTHQLPIQTEQTLAEFLQRQKTPIRIQLANQLDSHAYWLLNIDGEWLRVAGPKGLTWIPLVAIHALEIQAVDNSNH